MLIYAVVIAITTVLAILYTHIIEQNKTIVFCFMVLFPTLFSGLRGVATDYHLYHDNYQEILNGTFELVDYKSLFVMLVRILGHLGIGFQFVILLTSFLTVLIAFKIIVIFEKHINVPFAVFSYMTMFYQMSFNTYRQVLAAEIFLLATICLFKKGKVLKFGVLYLIAVLVHSSLLPFGIVFFFRKQIVEKRYTYFRVVIYTISLVGIFSLPLLAEKLVHLIGILSHYAWYLTRFQYSSIGFGFLRYFVLAVLPVLFVAYKKKYDEINLMGMGFIPFYLMMGTILWMTSYISTSSLYRIGYNFLVAAPILHGYLFEKYKLTSRFLICLFVCLVVVLFWIYDGVILDTGETIPYMFFWENI